MRLPTFSIAEAAGVPSAYERVTANEPSCEGGKVAVAAAATPVSFSRRSAALREPLPYIASSAII